MEKEFKEFYDIDFIDINPDAKDIFDLRYKYTNLTFELCKTYYDEDWCDTVLIYLYGHPIICFCERMLCGESGISELDDFSKDLDYFRKRHSWIHNSNRDIDSLSEVISVLDKYCSLVCIKQNCNAADFIMNI